MTRLKTGSGDGATIDASMSPVSEVRERAQAVLRSREAPDARKAAAGFVAQASREVAFQLEACVHCGACAGACHFWLVTRDARYTPVYKLRPLARAYRRARSPWARLARVFGAAPAAPTARELEAWSALLYDACNLCGRCTLVCPMGIDIADLVRRAREAMSAAGFAPADLYVVAERALDSGSPLGVRWPALRRQIELQEKETGLAVPVDRAGADYLVVLSAMEIVGYPEVIGALARLFAHAGASWTLASAAFEATNVGVQIGSRDVAAVLLARIAQAAERLSVKYVVSPECGHAYSALRWEGPNLIGRKYRFEVVQIAELLERWLREGRLRLRGRDGRRLTFHDPCQLVRRGGLDGVPQRVMESVSANFAPMPLQGAANYCCGGGGGVSAIARAEKLRFAAFELKKRQIEATRAEALVTACANCRNVLEEAIDACGMTLPVLGLTELVAQYLEPGPAAAAGRKP